MHASMERREIVWLDVVDSTASFSQIKSLLTVTIVLYSDIFAAKYARVKIF